MSATVYVVTSGTYSDYHIESVFSTELAAHEFIAAFDSAFHEKDAKVEEYELDSGSRAERLKEDGYTLHSVRLARNGDGSVWPCNEWHWQEEPFVVTPAVGRAPGYLYGAVYARDEQHALKIANEHRAMMIATDQWPEDTL